MGIGPLVNGSSHPKSANAADFMCAGVDQLGGGFVVVSNPILIIWDWVVPGGFVDCSKWRRHELRYQGGVNAVPGGQAELRRRLIDAIRLTADVPPIFLANIFVNLDWRAATI